MKELTPLNSTGIYIVEVQKYSENFRIGKNNKLEYWGNQEGNGYFCDDFEWLDIPLPNANWQILGTITSDIISFDPAPYLEKHYFTEGNKERQCYKCYDENNHKNAYWDTAEESFRSILNSCGYYWVNPINHPSIEDFNDDFEGQDDYAVKRMDWMYHENNLVTGILLSLIKK